MLGEFSLNNMKITFMGMLPTPKFLSYVLYVGPVRQYRYLTLREFSLNNTKIAFMGMLPTPKFLLYVPYVGPVRQYIAYTAKLACRPVRIIGTLEYLKSLGLKSLGLKCPLTFREMTFLPWNFQQ